MSFLKFVSFASFSLFFLGNVWAECIDLSGIYRCGGNPAREIEFTQSVDNQGITTYIMKADQHEAPLVANGEFDPLGMVKVSCDKDQLNFDLNFPQAKMTQKFSLANQGKVLLFKFTQTKTSGGNPIHQDLTCDRIQ